MRHIDSYKEQIIDGIFEDYKNEIYSEVIDKIHNEIMNYETLGEGDWDGYIVISVEEWQEIRRNIDSTN